ncbi:MAG: geranylgeranyl reductase family protein [Actinomycetota bacterium]
MTTSDGPGTDAGLDADVIVVGSGPGGSTAAYHLTQAGLDVLILEKAQFPREKVCGDGLTPRAVKSLIAMGIDTSETAPGWIRNYGLRIVGGGVRMELRWPELAAYPNYGLVRPRLDFDELLARTAEKAGARLHELTEVTGPVLDRTGRIVGVKARRIPPDDGLRRSRERHAGEERTYRARLVIAADGSSSRIALGMGLQKRDDRPMGVAVRRYFKSPRHDDDYLESHLELWQGDRLLPGYGWIFGVGDGTSNVGLGLLNTSEAFRNTDYRKLLDDWLKGMPPEWGYQEENATGPVRGGALPMGFNRQPAYQKGLVLVGDAAGAVNPFNGEGIAYAMETGQLAAEIITQALARDNEQLLHSYPTDLKARYGGYYTLGRIFVSAIGNPHVMKIATKYGLPRPLLMKFTLKLLANLTDPRGGDAMDRIINGMSKIAPAA